MDPIKHLQETLEQSLEEMNRDAMKKLAAQIAATVLQLQNGEPSKLSLLWAQGDEPDAIKQFIQDGWGRNYTYSMLLPSNRLSTGIEITGFNVVSLELPQNKLLLYYRP